MIVLTKLLFKENWGQLLGCYMLQHIVAYVLRFEPEL